MSISVNDKNLGHATAYAYAKSKGYQGTEEEFAQLLGNIAEDLSEIENLTVTVTTLPAGSSATASYADGVLYLGIPKGDKGDTGATPAMSIGTVTTLPAGDNATASIGGTTEAPVLNLGIPEGQAGDANNIAPDYTTGSHVVGEYCIHAGKSYRCIAPTSGAWDASCWVVAPLGPDVANLKNALDELDEVPELDTTRIDVTYTTGSFIDKTGVWDTGASYGHAVIAASEGQKYIVQLRCDKYVSLVAYLDASDNIIDYIPSTVESGSSLLTMEVVVPSQAVSMVISGAAVQSGTSFDYRYVTLINGFLSVQESINKNNAKVILSSNATVTNSNYTDYFSDYNDIPVNSIYRIANDYRINHHPDANSQQNTTDTHGNSEATVITFGQSSSEEDGVTQIVIGHNTPAYGIQNLAYIAFRNAYMSGGSQIWTDWGKFCAELFLQASNTVIRSATLSNVLPTADFNDLPNNTVYQVDLDIGEGDIAHDPLPGVSRMIQTVSFSTTITVFGRYQLLVGVVSGETKAFIRYGYNDNGAKYANWKEL